MRFPLGHPFERQVQIKFHVPEFPFYTVDFSACTWVNKMNLLKKVIASTEGVGGGKKVCVSGISSMMRCGKVLWFL